MQAYPVLVLSLWIQVILIFIDTSDALIGRSKSSSTKKGDIPPCTALEVKRNMALLRWEVQVVDPKKPKISICVRKKPPTGKICNKGKCCSYEQTNPRTKKIEENYACACPNGMTGKKCEVKETNVCESKPCQHGGTCKMVAISDKSGTSYLAKTSKKTQKKNKLKPADNGRRRLYICTCTPDFAGVNCESPADVTGGDFQLDDDTTAEKPKTVLQKGPQIGCKPVNPCFHFGTCYFNTRRGDKIYKCHCTSGYTGKRCESVDPETQGCHPDRNPCGNEATCIENPTNPDQPKCKCPAAFTGNTCQVSLTRNRNDAKFSCQGPPNIGFNVFRRRSRRQPPPNPYRWKEGEIRRPHNGKMKARVGNIRVPGRIPGAMKGLSPKEKNRLKQEQQFQEDVARESEQQRKKLDEIVQQNQQLQGKLGKLEKKVGKVGQQASGNTKAEPEPEPAPAAAEDFHPNYAAGRCVNGGKCIPEHQRWVCACRERYFGQFCEHTKGASGDPCNPNPCRNEARCLPRADDSGYECQCYPGFYGGECEKPCPVGFWGNCLRRCQNCAATKDNNPDCDLATGVCVDDNGKVACEAGYRGEKCDEEEEEFDCDNFNPCEYGGTCTTEGCICPPGAGGVVCEKCVPKKLAGTSKVPTICKNGGKCTQFDRCDCAPGWGGDRCEDGCESPNYGKNCGEECGKCEEKCNPEQGCEECDDGFWGPKCDKDCGEHQRRKSTVGKALQALAGGMEKHCKDNKCKRANGKCEDGCEENWTGSDCDRRSTEEPITIKSLAPFRTGELLGSDRSDVIHRGFASTEANQGGGGLDYPAPEFAAGEYPGRDLQAPPTQAAAAAGGGGGGDIEPGGGYQTEAGGGFATDEKGDFVTNEKTTFNPDNFEDATSGGNGTEDGNEAEEDSAGFLGRFAAQLHFMNLLVGAAVFFTIILVVFVCAICVVASRAPKKKKRLKRKVKKRLGSRKSASGKSQGAGSSSLASSYASSAASSDGSQITFQDGGTWSAYTVDPQQGYVTYQADGTGPDWSALQQGQGYEGQGYEGQEVQYWDGQQYQVWDGQQYQVYDGQQVQYWDGQQYQIMDGQQGQEGQGSQQGQQSTVV